MHQPTAEEILETRLNAELSQFKCAVMLGVTERTFRRWEHGDNKMPPRKWEKFLNAIPSAI